MEGVMHVIKWRGLYGQIVVREYKTMEEAEEMIRWLRKHGVGCSHTLKDV
jgi:hypothetical protein